MKLDAYIRVSRVAGREGESFISPELQRERIAAYCTAKGYTVIEWHEELDQSGRKDDRPLFQLALERVERGDSGGIIVARLDRFARSVLGAKVALQRLEAAGGAFVAVDNSFDTATPFGKFGLTLMMAIAELESDRIKETWASSQRKAVARGVHVASRAPTGYERGEGSRLVTSSAAPAVRELFLQRAAGASLRELGAILREHGAVGPYGNDFWPAQTVAKMLRNPVYYGQARSGVHVLEGAHEAIVSRNEWLAAQAPQVLLPEAKKGEPPLLSGLIRCAGCRYLMKPDKLKQRDGSYERVYRCRGEHASGACKAKAYVMARVVEPYVVETFKVALGPGGMLARRVAAVVDLEPLYTALKEAEAERDFWLAEQSMAAIGAEAYNAGLKARAQRVVELEQQIAGAAADSDELPDQLTFEQVWAEATVGEQRKILAAGIDCLMLKAGKGVAIEDRALILWHGQAPDDLPRRGRRQDSITAFDWPAPAELEHAA